MRKTYTGTMSPQPLSPDKRLSSPSAARNIGPILNVMQQTMPQRGSGVEIASGTGEHCVRFAAEFPGITWTPSDVDAQRLDSIRAWIAESSLSNLRPPVVLNAEQSEWPFAQASCDVAVTVNLTHLISAEVMGMLFAGVARLLKPGGQWFLYGPFIRNGEFASDGDRAFHQQLTGQDPAIGYKDISAVSALAAQCGLSVGACHDMPANNLMFVFQAAS